MSRFAIVALLPESVPGQADFVSREFNTVGELAEMLFDLEAKAPNWRVLSFVHIEDLPLLMEPPNG